jgi:predicted secreted protein
MAVKSGNKRRVYITPSGSAATKTWIAGEQSNSVNYTNNAIDASDKSTEWDQFISGNKSWTASATFNLDNAASTQQKTLLQSLVNGAEVETKQAVDHAVVFENVALADGANTVTAKSCRGVEDTITLNGVAEHNAAYTLPDIAAAMAVGNWFDEVADNEDSEEIVVVDGCYSIEDTYGDPLSNEECFKIVKGWLMKQGNLTLASMLTTLRDMMGFMKFSESGAASGLMGNVTAKDMAQLNRLLSRVKK